MTPREQRNERLAQKLKKSLERRHYEVHYCKRTEDIVSKVRELIPEGSSVSWGGSMSIRDTGVTQMLKQGRYVPMTFMEEAVALYAGGQGYIDDIPVSDTTRFRAELLEYIRASKPEILESIATEKKFTDEIEKDLNAAIEEFKSQFLAK